MSFLEDYEPVEDRLEKFWADHPEGRIETEMLPAPEGQFIVKASVFRGEGEVSATGLAYETIGSSPVNKTSALENCETSAIGRALANLGYAAKGKRASREEMEKASRTDVQQAPAEWLATAVDAFGLWTPDQRRAAYKTAMLGLELDKLKTKAQAEKMFEAMAALYYQEFPDVSPF